MSKELLLLEALCEKLGFEVEFEEAMEIPSGQIGIPARYILKESSVEPDGFKPSLELRKKGTWYRK